MISAETVIWGLCIYLLIGVGLAVMFMRNSAPALNKDKYTTYASYVVFSTSWPLLFLIAFVANVFGVMRK